MAGMGRRVGGAGLLALALGGCGIEPVGAQDGWLQAPDIGFIALGISTVSTGDLDNRLAANGYPTFGRRAVQPSLGAYWDLPGGVILGGEWHGIVLREEPHEGGEVVLGGGYGTIGVGYAVELSPRARIYPRLGLGGGGLGLWIETEEMDGGPREAVGFDEALEDPWPAPDQYSVLSRTHGVIDLGAGAEFMLGRGRGALIGVRLGYRATPFLSSWELELDEWDATGGPDATLAGPYLQVVIGGGRRR